MAFLTLWLIGAMGGLCAAPPPPPAPESSAIVIQDQTPLNWQERAKERAQRGRLLYFVSLGYEALLLAGFFAFGGSRWLVRVISPLAGRWMWAALAAIGIIGLGGALLTLPLDYYRGFVFAHQYGLSNQNSGDWFREYLVSMLVGTLLGVPLILLVYALLRRFPRSWWCWFGVFMLPLSIFFMLIYPLFITPLFNRFTPLHDEELRGTILALAHQQGIQATDVYQMDASRQSNAVNAYVVGIGPTQRIVLYDTLLREFTQDEILFVMAHEMGHYVLGHIPRGILYSVLGTLLAAALAFRLSSSLLVRYGARLGYQSLGHPASYPLLLALLMVFSLAATPISNALSRGIEWEADRFAVSAFPHPEAGIAAFENLARINLSEKNPPAWAELLLYSHPSLSKRIATLQRYRDGDPNPWPLPRQ